MGRKANTKLAFIAGECAIEVQNMEVINRMIEEDVIKSEGRFLFQ